MVCQQLWSIPRRHKLEQTNSSNSSTVEILARTAYTVTNAKVAVATAVVVVVAATEAEAVVE